MTGIVIAMLTLFERMMAVLAKTDIDNDLYHIGAAIGGALLFVCLIAACESSGYEDSILQEVRKSVDTIEKRKVHDAYFSENKLYRAKRQNIRSVMGYFLERLSAFPNFNTHGSEAAWKQLPVATTKAADD